jgi:prevent-host-death family protein
MLIEKEIGAFEAKNKLSALLDEAAQGQRIWITKRGRRVALLSSGLSGGSGSQQSLLCDEFRRIRKAGSPGPETLKELIEAGHR